MKSKLFFSCLLFFLFTFKFSGELLALGNTTLIQEQNDPKDYTRLWKRVDSLDEKGLRRSAYDLSVRIFTLAKSEGNSAQLVKAMIHRLKFQDYTEEDAMLKNIRDLETETGLSKFPERVLLHSMLAEMYWRYYENNRYRFLERSQTVGVDEKDPATWDLGKIVRTCLNYYSASLSENSSTKKIPIHIFDSVLIVGKPQEARNFRSTLYDFLAHRALDFYMNTETGLTKPADRFSLNVPAFLNNAEEFVKLDFPKTDTSDFKYKTCLLFQEAIAFHLTDSDPGALIDVDMKRLSFIKSSMNLLQKDSLYENALNQLATRYRSHAISTEVLYELAALYEQRGNLYNPEISDVHKWDLQKAIEYCDAAVSQHPGSRGASLAENMKARLNMTSVSFITENVNPMGRVFRARVEYKNTTKLFCRVIRDTRDISFAEHGYNDELFIRKIIEGEVLKSWTVDLPVDTDLQNQSVEIAIPSLDFGKYILMISDQEQFIIEKSMYAYGSFRISDMSLLSRILTNGAYEFFVLDRISGEPLNRVSVEATSFIYNRLTSVYDTVIIGNYLSDKSGRFEIPPHKESGRNFNLKVISGKDILFLNEGFYQYNSGRRQPQVAERTAFFTDRSIYRPGQLIYFKALLLQVEDGYPGIKPNYTTTVQFFDVNGQLISEQKLKSNEYGTIQGEFTAPQGVLNGIMQIRNSSGAVGLSIEEYKRPRFETIFEPVKGTYRVNEKVTISGSAKTYSGVAVDGATVRYRVSRIANFPPWCFWYRGLYPQSPAQELLSGESTTDGSGNFSFSFVAQADESIAKKYQPVFNYEISADVTDLNGETRSSRTILRAGYTSMELSTDIPEVFDFIKKGKYKIVAKNFSGNHVPAKVALTIYKMKEPERLLRSRKWARADKRIYTEAEYINKFPLDVYDREDDFLFREKQMKVWSGELNTATDSILNFFTEEWGQGFYLMEGNTMDSFGEEVKLIHYFTICHSESRTPARNEISRVHVLKDNAEPGDSDEVLISTSASNVFVLLQTIVRNEIKSSEWIRLSKEQRIIRIPVKEEYRGNFSLAITMVKESRVFRENILLKVPWTTKDLSVEYSTFRSTLEPGKKEEWRLKLKDQSGGLLNAELLASMYDASLDAFKPHNWKTGFYNSYGVFSSINDHGFSLTNSRYFSTRLFEMREIESRTYDELNWFDYIYSGFNPYVRGGREMLSEYSLNSIQDKSAPPLDMASGATMKMEEPQATQEDVPDLILKEENKQVEFRKNLRETAFFYPQVHAQADSSFTVSFTSPEALTRWKFQLFAHTADLKYVFDEKEVITQKELMLTPNLPRFLRAGDTISVSSKINSLNELMQEGLAEMHILDAITMNSIDSLFKNFSIAKKFSVNKENSESVFWNFMVPENIPAVIIRITAKAGKYSDGEEHVLPVLSNRQLVTESLPIWTRGNATRNYELKKLTQNTSSTLQHHRLKLEYTSNPIWTVVQALPYLMEYPYQCAEQVFSRYYANSIATHIANSSPKIKAIFDSWKTLTTESFLSKLEKNQELKSVVLAETPWVLEAKGEKERKERIALLFDLNRMSNEQSVALIKLQKQQMPNGAWPWFEGMPDNRYITQHIVTGLLQLQNLKILEEGDLRKINLMINNALVYLDKQIAKDYHELLRLKSDTTKYSPSALQVHYLYLRSFSAVTETKNVAGIEHNYFLRQTGKFWLSNNEYLQAMIALSHHRHGNKSVATDILNSLKDIALHSDEMGMYWKNVSGGYYWKDAAIETQSLLIETFTEVLQDNALVEEMKIWLLRQKQTHNWKSTKSTVAACYALLLRGNDWIEKENVLRITVGSQIIQTDDKKLNQESGTGNFSTSWSGNEIQENMGRIQVIPLDKADKTISNVSWGALYWQYFENLDKITDAETKELKLTKNLFVQRSGSTGPVIEKIGEHSKVKVGDRIIVRITLSSDRDMEFLHLKDLRAAGMEPENVLSGYKWQDGLGYYESTGDVSTDFFIPFLPRGIYVFEYSLRAFQAGGFSSGITSIQNMYAPEYSAHSFGERLQILTH